MIGILCVHQCFFLFHIRAECSSGINYIDRLERFIIYEDGRSGGHQSRLLQLLPGKAALCKVQRCSANDSAIRTGACCSHILHQVSLIQQGCVFNRNHICVDPDGVTREQALLAGLVCFRDHLPLLVKEAENGYFVHDRLERLLHGDTRTSRCFEAVISFDRVRLRGEGSRLCRSCS